MNNLFNVISETDVQILMNFFKSLQFLNARRKTGCFMEWPCPSVGPLGRPSVRPSTIACERDILKTTCRIDFTF